MPDGGSVDKGDLYLMMESYNNMVKLNTILVEQQKALLKQNDNLQSKSAEILNSILKISENLTKALNDIDRVMSQSKDCSKQCLSKFSDVREKLEVYKGDVITLRESISSDTVDSNKDVVEKFSSLKLNLVVIYSVLGSIVVSLISMLYMTYSKFELIREIAKHLGVQ